MTISIEKDFIEAIYHGNVNSINILFKEKKIDIKSRLSTDFFNRTPIQLAIQSDNFKLIEYLFNKGADVLTVDGSGDMNFIDYVLSTAFSLERAMSEMKEDPSEWIKTYKIQKIILDRTPEAYKTFKKYDAVNEKIKKEFAYLESGTDLNLI